MKDSEGPRIFSADEITLLTASRSAGKADRADDDHFILVEPEVSTYYSQGLLTFLTPQYSVEEPVEVVARWMGDDEVEPAYGFDFDPEGLQFARPVRLRVSLDDVAEYEGLDRRQYEEMIEQAMLLYDLEDGNYEEVPSTILRLLDPDGRMHVWIQGVIHHFSKYIVGNGPPGGGGNGGE